MKVESLKINSFEYEKKLPEKEKVKEEDSDKLSVLKKMIENGEYKINKEKTTLSVVNELF